MLCLLERASRGRLLLGNILGATGSGLHWVPSRLHLTAEVVSGFVSLVPIGSGQAAD